MSGAITPKFRGQRFFLPTDISDCILWLDAMDPAAVTNGSSTWKDKSKNKYIGKNGAGSFSIVSQNNLSYYTGEDIYIDNFTMRNTFTYFLVGEITDGYFYGDGSAGIYTYFNVNHGSGPGTEYDPTITFSTASWRIIRFFGMYTLGETYNYGNTSTPGGNFFIFAIGFNFTSKITPFQINGYKRSTYSGEFTSLQGRLSSIRDGYRTKRLSFFVEDLFPRGSGHSQKYCECLIFDRSLSEEETQRVEGYLAAKWNLQKRLPSTHSFKNLKPLY